MRFFAGMSLRISAFPIVMWRDAYDLNDHDISLHGVDDPPLLVQPGRPKAFPITRQRLIPKALDSAEPLRPGKHGNVFPFLVALQYLGWHASGGEILVRLAML